MQRKWLKEGNFNRIANYVYIMKKVIYRHADNSKGHLQINGFDKNQVSITYYNPSKELFDVCIQREFINYFSGTREAKWCIGIDRTSNKYKLAEFIEIIDHFDSLDEIKKEIYDHLEIAPQIQNYENAKMKKRTILQNAPLTLLKPGEKPDCVNAILSQVYTDIADTNLISEIITFLSKRIMECTNFQTNSLIAPLLNIIALSSINGSKVIKSTPKYQLNQSRKLFHNLEIKDKKLKTIISIDPKFIQSLAENADTYGLYTYKHSLFATAYNEKNILKIFELEPTWQEIVKSNDHALMLMLIAVIFHEAAHYAAVEVMANPKISNPFNDFDHQLKNQYLDIFHHIKKVYPTWVANNNQEKLAIFSISMAFDKSYAEEKQPSELFVQIPEIIGALGYQDGLIVLNKFVPELVEFYEKKFNPACIKYLVRNNIESFITVDPHFALALKQNRIRMNIRDVIDLGVFGVSSSLALNSSLQNKLSSQEKIEKNIISAEATNQQHNIQFK